MNLNDLPNEIVTRCFSHLSTELLIDIILLENIPDNVLEAAVNNLNHLWYSERIQGIQRGDIENRIEGIEAYYETDFDRFLRIHKILDEKSLKCPLWFNYTWNNIHEMHKSLDEINLAYNGQKLGIHADIDNPAFEFYPIFSDHDINLKITCLSLILRAHSRGCVDLNDFPKLETFYGAGFKMEVNYDHPSLKNLYLNNVTISTLPINLIKLVIKNCVIRMNENHPKLEALTVLALEDTQRPSDCSAIISVLWNKDLEHFSYISPGVSSDEILSMVGPKVTSFKLAGSISAEIPTLLRSLYSINNDGLTNLTAFTHMTSLTLWQPSGDINSFELPPNLLELTLYKPTGEIDSLNFPLSLVKLSIRVAKFKDLAKVDFPPNLVDLKLEFCRITLTVGWLKTARLKRLSLASNLLSSFHAVLPCCEFLCLKRNNLTAVDIEAPFLQHIDLYKNKLTSVPKLPSCVQVLLLDNNELYLPEMSDLPPNLKRLALSGTGAFENYTFPSSLEQLSLENLASRMSGVKFAEGSRLRELNMSCCRLGTISDRKIQLPFGLKSLQLRYNHLRHINTLTIPQTVTSLGLQRNPLKSLKVKSHIETLYLNENRLSSLTIPKDLELKYLELKLSGLEKFSFDLFGAERLTQLCLGPEFKVIDVSKMPVSFQILEFPGSNSFEIEGLHRYPESDIWRRFL